MEIRLGTIEDKFPDGSSTVNFEDQITIREYQAIQKALKELNEFKSNKHLIDIVLLNHSEIHFFFSHTFDSLLKKSVSWIGIKDEDMEDLYLQSNRLLLNYLSSIRTYIDHSLKFLSNKYGKQSSQLKRFENLLSFNFDNNFCHRFFYKLRNYSQHCGVPIDSINFTSEYNRENNKIHGYLNAFFNPEKLLQEYDSWGVNVKSDLQKKAEVFELRELRESMAAIMFNLNVNFNKINSPRTIKAAKYLFEKTKHLDRNDKKQICVFYGIKTKENGELSNFSNTPIPLKLIVELLNKKTAANKR
jgi:hypothetical protein